MLSIGLSIHQRALGVSLESAAVAAAVRNNAALWYVPQNLAGVWQDDAGTIPATLGSPVGRLNDIAMSWHATQSTTANKPTLAQLANGKYALSFDGTSDHLRHSLTAVGYNSCTLICAGIATATAGDRTMHSIRSSSNTNTIVAQMWTTGGNAGPRYAHRRADASNLEMPTASGNRTTPFVASANSTGAARTLHIDGVSAATSANVTSATSADQAAIGAAIGLGVAPAFWQGQISLVCLSPAAMPDVDRIAIERFAASIVGATYAA